MQDTNTSQSNLEQSAQHTEQAHASQLSRQELLRVAGVSVVASLIFVTCLAFFAYQYRAELFPATTSVRAIEHDLNEAQRTIAAREPIVDIVARASDAVVSVVITKDVPILEQYYERYDPFGGWGPFGGFEVPRVRQLGTEEQEVGGGTGFFVSDDGLLVTNRHVVSDEEARYSIVTNDGESFEAEVLVRDPQMDIAVLRIADIPNDAYEHLSFGDSDALMPGQSVVAIGNALAEFRNSVSVGVISGLARSITAGDRYGGATELLEGVIQTDTAINPGNSGGPLLDITGAVIGVNVAIAGGAENIAFSIPSNVVSGIVTSVAEYGEIRRPYLGVRYIELNERIQENNELAVGYGAWLKGGVEGPAILKDSPAQQAGLQENDVIIALDDVSLDDASLAALVRRYDINDTVTVEYYRGAERRSVDIVLQSAPSDSVEAGAEE